jgi:hypothetical protein
MDPRQFLRVEGLAALAAALGVFLGLEGPLWLLAVLALAPDLSMLGYLGGPRAGSLAYNLAHTYTLPLALAGIRSRWREAAPRSTPGSRYSSPRCGPLTSGPTGCSATA